MRLSSARDDGQPINNLPGLYLTEDWVVHYWDVEPKGELRSRQAVVQLPFGCAGVSPAVEIGQNGCVHHVRRWGVQLQIGLLESMGFDPLRQLSLNQVRYPDGDDAAVVHILIQASHFELPSHFVIASNEHPLLLFDPEGTLKGSYTGWHTYLGALAYMVSDSRVHGTFGRLRTENRMLYEQALSYLQQALARLAEEHKRP
jgi:hypothetical protein